MKSYSQNKTHNNLLLLSLLLLCSIKLSYAQISGGRLEVGEQSISVLTGIEYAILPLIVEYRKSVSVLQYQYPFEFGVELTTPLFNPDINDVRIKGKIATTLYATNSININAELNPVYVRTKLQTLSANSLGLELISAASWSNQNWRIGGEFSLTKMITSHFTHSEKYKNNIFNEVADGWYANTATNMQLGIIVDRRINRIDLILRTGVSRTGQFSNYLFVPSVYTKLGFAYRI